MFFLYVTNARVRVNGRIKCIRGISIKIVQSSVALVKLEDKIWASVEKYGRLVNGIYGNSEITVNIN